MSTYTDWLTAGARNEVFLFTLYPVEFSSAAVTTIRVATKGYVSHASDSPAGELWKPRIVEGFSIGTTLYGRNQVGRTASASFSRIRYVNRIDPSTGVGECDAWPTTYSFSGRRVTIQHGGAHFALADFETILDGTFDAEPSVGHDETELPVRDKRALLDREPQAPIYAGGGEGEILFDYNGGASTGRATIAKASAANIDHTGPMIAMFCFRTLGSADQPAAITGFFGWGRGPAAYPYDVVVLNANTASPSLRFRCTHSGGTVQTMDYSETLEQETDYVGGFRIDSAGVVSGFTKSLAPSIEARLAGTTWETLGTVGGVRDACSAGGSFTIGYGDVAMHGLRIWTDEGWVTTDKGAYDVVEEWKRGIEREILVADRGTGGLGTGSEKGDLAAYWKCTDGTGATITDSSANGYDLNLTGTYTWGYPLTGVEAVQGKRMPICLGEPKRFRPVLIDPARLIFQVHHGEINDITNVYENGGDIDLDTTFGTFGYASSLAAFLADAVVGGKFGAYLPLGLFKLGSSVSGVITCIAQGDVNGGAGSYDDDPGPVLKKLLGYASQTMTVDTTAYNAFHAATAGNAVGIYIDPDDSTKLQRWIDFNLLGVRGWWLFGGDGEAEPGQFNGPASSADWELGNFNAVIDGVKIEPMTPPVGLQRYGYKKTWEPVSEENLAGTIPDAERVLHSGKYRWIQMEEDSIRDLFAQPTEGEDLETALLNRNAAFAQAAERQQIYGMPGRMLIRVTVGTIPQAPALGDTVNFTYPRFGLSAGRLMVIVGWDTGKRVLALWG